VKGCAVSQGRECSYKLRRINVNALNSKHIHAPNHELDEAEIKIP
jgi:hypothetical protein